MTVFEILREKLQKAQQEHLVRFWDDLSTDEQRQLGEDIEEINFVEVKKYFEIAKASSLNEETTKLDDQIQPIPETQFVSISRTPGRIRDVYRNIGLRQISEGHVGILLMAGGQGTRLGFPHPKGMYDVGLLSGKTLFRIQAERILKLEELAEQQTGKRGNIVWYIMTSEHTKQPTLKYFAKENYFGLNEDNIVTFSQCSLPCFEFDGKIILDQRHRIARAPDGNGGIYRALKDKGVLNDMNRRGVKYLHAHSVDNILVKVADPVFVGYCVLEGADCAAKVVERCHPNEAVGVICMVDGKYQVVEYSEISAKTAELRNSDGRLTFNAGNICNHFFSTSFLNNVAAVYESQLKLHVAKKKIPFVDNSGKRIIPNKPNGIKIEKFVFDVFEFAQKFVVMEVQRDAEFSALKNADSSGKDCPSTARSDLFKLHKQYIEDSGGIVHGEECEISPFLTYAGEGIEELVNGKSFTSPVYLRSAKDPKNDHL